MKLIKKNTKKGFTLIELVIVIAILAILALILVPTLGNFTGKAKEAKIEASLRSMYTEAVIIASETTNTTDGLIKTEIEGQITPSTDGDVVVVEVDAGTVTKITYTSNGITKSFDGKSLGN